MTAAVLALPQPGSTLLIYSERHLVWLLAEDYTPHEIARHYRISRPKAERRIQALLAKTGTGTAAELVATALRCGWIGDDDEPEWSR